MDEFFDALNTHPLLVVDVYKEDCEPCQRFLKIFDRVRTTIQQANGEIVKVNVADFSDIKTMYEIDQVPTFLYFKNGQLVTKHFGIKPMTEMVTILKGL
jgi:thioredoxin-like negative regulator of GroEL